MERNRFLHDDRYGRDKPLERSLVGFAATPAFPDPGSGRARGQLEFLPALLENAAITGNEFAGLTMAVFVRAEFGRLRCEDNFAHGCDGGFYFANTDHQFTRESLLDAFRNRARSAAHEAIFTTLLHTAQASVLSAMHDLATRAPLPAGLTIRHTVKIGQGPDAATTKKVRAEARRANAQLLAGLSAPETKPVAGAISEATGLPTTSPVHAAEPEPTPAAPAPSVTQPSAAAEISAAQIRQMTTSFLVRFPADAALVRHTPALRFAGNDVESLPNAIRSQKDVAPPMVGLWATLDPQLDASVMIASNDIRGAGPQAIASISRPRTAIVTGNLISNPGGGKNVTSLFIQAVEQSGLMNVSGNAFWGDYSINPSPATAGSTAGNWNVLNSVKP